ncbi:MAG: hypothetical protein IPN94_26325 [Sphingobacteriales bacterium]|nr:hypothetical protein [Sphingobacteriales bacterium]
MTKSTARKINALMPNSNTDTAPDTSINALLTDLQSNFDVVMESYIDDLENVGNEVENDCNAAAASPTTDTTSLNKASK